MFCDGADSVRLKNEIANVAIAKFNAWKDRQDSFLGNPGCVPLYAGDSRKVIDCPKKSHRAVTPSLVIGSTYHS